VRHVMSRLAGSTIIFGAVALLAGCTPPTRAPVDPPVRIADPVQVKPATAIPIPPPRAGERLADILTPGGNQIGLPYKTERFLNVESLEAARRLFDRLSAGTTTETKSKIGSDNVVKRNFPDRQGWVMLREERCQRAQIRITVDDMPIGLLWIHWPAKAGEAACDGGMDG